ncbi:MAG: DUF5703 domain-containing protein [Fimbriimonas sp.]
MAALVTTATLCSAGPGTLDAYDIVWATPSKDAAGSMPIGNGEVALNAWVEAETGDILFLIGRSDSHSELGRILKLGRVRVSLSPSPFTDSTFRQHLRLRDGEIRLSGDGETLRLFVDSDAHVVHLQGRLKAARNVAVRVESWRDAPHLVADGETSSAWAVSGAPFPLMESADVFPEDAQGVTWYHRNETSVVPKLWENQSLTGLPGAFDPLLHRTFGGRATGKGLVREGRSLRSRAPLHEIDIQIVTHTAQTATVGAWQQEVARLKPARNAAARTRAWWHRFWDRSWVFVDGDRPAAPVPPNDFPLRVGFDSGGGNRFPGTIHRAFALDRVLPQKELATATAPAVTPKAFPNGLTLVAEIEPTAATPGRILDRMTAGLRDGFLFDTHPGTDLRFIVGGVELIAPKVLTLNQRQTVAATYDPETGETAIYRNGARVAHLPGEHGSLVTRGYVLQRYVQACQGRGQYPIKFNGGTLTVEPAAMGRPFNPDYRQWGDPHWFQNLRHMYHPMLAGGDFEMMEPFFRLYESVRPLGESRNRLYHQAEGVYFPETMTVWGAYSGNDYGWKREGLAPSEVQSPWWRWAWNQGPELVALMLDRWDGTRDEKFLRERTLPMAESVLRYFDTRFRKDARGKIVLDPTQVVETYWEGVQNDTPTVAGLIEITRRLTSLPRGLATADQAAFFARMKAAVPALPLETTPEGRRIAPAERYVNKRSNVENGELYAVWPFRVVSLSQPALMDEARLAYRQRGSQLPVGWGYDGNVAARLGLTEEAVRILGLKVRNSNPAYRWPATWGPNFDWLPDQNHGGNLLNQTNLMLLQSDPLEEGGALRLFPAWPQEWDVDFRLHAAGRTVVHAVLRGGKLATLEVSPAARRKDVVLPEWLR